MHFNRSILFACIILIPLALSAQFRPVHTQIRNVPLFLSAPAQDTMSGDRWWAQDKGRHLIGSMISTVFIGKLSQEAWRYSTGQSRYIGGGITLLLGIGKEINDSRNPDNIFSVKDIVADVAGIAIGIFLLGAT